MKAPRFITNQSYFRRAVCQLEQESFCFTTESPTCTVLENNNTNWSVFLSSKENHEGGVSNDLVAHMFVNLLARENSNIIVSQGSVTGILRKFPLSTNIIRQKEEEIILRKTPNLALHVVSIEEDVWKIAYGGVESKPVAEKFCEVASEKHMAFLQNEQRVIEGAQSTIQVSIGIPKSLMSEENIKETADEIVSILAHPKILPFSACEPVAYILETQETPTVNHLTL